MIKQNLIFYMALYHNNFHPPPHTHQVYLHIHSYIKRREIFLKNGEVDPLNGSFPCQILKSTFTYIYIQCHKLKEIDQLREKTADVKMHVKRSLLFKRIEHGPTVKMIICRCVVGQIILISGRNINFYIRQNIRKAKSGL